MHIYAQIIVIFIQKTCGCLHACNHARTLILIVGVTPLTNRTVKGNRELCPEIPSLQCAKNVRKVRENTCRLDLQLVDQIFRSAECFWMHVLLHLNLVC